MGNRFAGFVLNRILTSIAIIFTISLLIFLIVQLIPGDAVDILLGGISEQSLGHETIEELRSQFGLDLPLHVQYLNWMRGVLRGDLGTSLVFKRPITPIVLIRLKASLILAIPAGLMIVVFGLSLGVIGAVNEDKVLDHFLTVSSLGAISIPSFVIGSIFIYIFAVNLRWIPVAFNSFDYIEFTFWGKLVFFFSALIFPSLTLAFQTVAHIARHTRASMIKELKTKYFRTAILKGVPSKRVILQHALRNALLPAVTVIAIQAGYIIGGVVIVEIIFSYPGIGNLALMAIKYRDVPLILSTMLVVSGGYVFANFFADILYAFLNPRIRY